MRSSIEAGEMIIGFVLLTYRHPARTLRLIRRLNRSFDDPPIVLHHDFGQSDFPVAELPGNVTLVVPHQPTGWGTFGTLEALLKALKILMRGPRSPDWFVFLSGSDYPIKTAEEIARDMVESESDAFIQMQAIDPFRLPPLETGPTIAPGVGARWAWLGFERWFGRDVTVRYVDRGLRWSRRTMRLRSRWLGWTHGPFREGFRCFGGEATITANRRCAEYILDFHERRPELANHFRGRANVDEAYLHCIVGNAPELRVTNDSRRYADWTPAGTWHPKTVTVDDLPRLAASRAHFARKFDPEVDAEVLDRLDALLG